jgi:hypothetical protein
MKNKAVPFLLVAGLALNGCSSSKEVFEPTTYGVEHKEHDATNHWEPNEGQLVQAGDLVMNLKRELGHQPTATEMQNYLQTNMGVSSEHAHTILDELGLV